MLLNTLVKAVKRKSHRGDQAVTTDQITTDVIACINETIRDIYKLLPKRFLFKQGSVALSAGVAGTAATYSLASDVQEPIIFHFTSGGALYILDKVDTDRDWIKGVWDPNLAVNRPEVYREIGPNSSTGYKQIEVFPIPSGSFTLNYEYYRSKGVDLTSSDLASEVTIIPDQFQDCLEKGALYYFLKGFDDPMQGVAKTDYEESKHSLNVGDDQDKDTDLAFKYDNQVYYRQPGFKR